MGNSLYCTCQPYKEQTNLMNNLDGLLKSENLKESLQKNTDYQIDPEIILEEEHIKNIKKDEKEGDEVKNNLFENFRNSVHQNYFEKPNILSNSEKNEEKLNEKSYDNLKRGTKGIEALKKALFSSAVDQTSPNLLKEKISLMNALKSKAFITTRLSIPNFTEFQFSKSVYCNNVPPYQKMQRKSPTEFVMFTDKLIKFNSTLYNNFIPKYCRITDESFQYFKDDNCYISNKERPFFSIPLNVIENVRIVSFQEILGKPLFFFEIIAPKLEDLKKSSNLMMIHEIQPKESIHKKNILSQNYSLTKKASQIYPGHLMREVIPGFNDCTKMAELVEPEKQVLYEGIRFKTENHLEDFLKFKKENKEKLYIPVILKPKESKEVSGILRNTYSWTYREVDWFNSEKAYIFGVTNEINLKKWVCLLNWIISSQNSKDK